MERFSRLRRVANVTKRTENSTRCGSPRVEERDPTPGQSRIIGVALAQGDFTPRSIQDTSLELVV